MPEPPTLPRARSTPAAEAAFAVLIAVVFAAAARAFFQQRMLVDGAGLATFFGRGDRLAYHFLYLPACRVVAPLVGWTRPGDPIEATRLLSALSFGLGTAFTWLFASELRRRGAGDAGGDTGGALGGDLGGAWRAASFGAFLVALSPAAVFFATTVEVHALNYATVAFASWAVLRLPWRRPALATGCAAALFGLVFWAHQLDLLLGPGWVLLCGLCARRAGRPLSCRALVLGVGPALLGGALAASALANWLRTGSALPSAEHELGILSAFLRPPEAWRFVWDGWLLPLALVVPFAAFGFARGAFGAGERAMLAVSVLVPTAFLFAWGVAEHGGYVLAQAPFLAALIAGGVGHASGVPRAPGRAAALGQDAALLVQAALAVWIVVPLGRGFDVDRRAELVAAHLDGGTFLATAPNAPSITLYIPGAFEFVTDSVLVRAQEEGRAPEEVVALLLASARAELARTGRLVYDLGYETQLDRAPIRERTVVLDPLKRALEAEFTTTRIDDPHWPLLIVQP